MKNSEFEPRTSNLEPGIVLFNSHRFWEALEAWETIWLASSGPHKIFLQGLIQLAAAYHHVQRGTFRGAIRLFDAAFAKLDPYPLGYAGVDRADVIDVARGHRMRIAAGERIDAREYAKLTLDGE